MNPPSLLPAKPTPGSVAASIRAGLESLVTTTSAPWAAAMLPASWVADTGRATLSPAILPGSSDSRASSASLSLSTWPSSSIRRRRSPSGSSTAPRCDPDARTSSPTRWACSSRSARSSPAVDTNGLTANTSRPSLASTLGMAKEVDPKA